MNNSASGETPVQECGFLVQTQAMNLEQACALAVAGESPVSLSPYADSPCLLVDATQTRPATNAGVLHRWLSTLACPSIVIAGEGGDPELLKRFDVVLPDAVCAQPVVDAVRRNPVAATTFVQVLRTTENLPVADGLVVESLAYATLQGGAEYARWLEDNRFDAPFRPAEDGPAVVMERDGAALRLVLNRASNHNAMSVEMRDALVEALSLVAADDSIKQVAISGRGRCFSTGGDLTEFGTVPDVAIGHIVRSLRVPGRFLAGVAQRATVHMHGACIGSGVEFPVFASRVTAAPGTHFKLPEVGMGLIPGAGGCISIAKRIGRQRLAWWGLTGKRIRANTALAWGLVDELID